MIDLIVSIVDRLISLLKERERFDRSTYDDFIVSILNDFEALHTEYLKFFEAYRVRINQTNFPVNEDDPLIKDIKRDALFNADALSKLRILESDAKNPLIGKFIRSILGYVNCSRIDPSSEIEIRIEENAEDIYQGSKIYNVARETLILSFERLKAEQTKKSQDEMRVQATKKLDEIVSLLQTHYQHVREQHHRLKRKLLN